MGYSIFEETMVDLTWVEVEQVAKAEAIVLFPMGVIEEHGPHLCVGTDIYISYTGCKGIKQKLEEKGQMTVIAPPYYWGINHATGGFPGSFTVRKETMQNMLYDTLQCLEKWGFKHIYCFYGHGDPVHIQTIIETMQIVRKEMPLDAKMVVLSMSLQRMGLTGNEDYILSVTPDFAQMEASVNEEKDENECKQQPKVSYEREEQKFEIHAGGMETADLKSYYPELVHEEIAKKLPSTDLTKEQLKVWNQGGEAMRKMLPQGYAGSPARYKRYDHILEEDEFIFECTAQTIVKDLEDSKIQSK